MDHWHPVKEGNPVEDRNKNWALILIKSNKVRHYVTFIESKWDINDHTHTIPPHMILLHLLLYPRCFAPYCHNHTGATHCSILNWGCTNVMPYICSSHCYPHIFTFGLTKQPVFNLFVFLPTSILVERILFSWFTKKIIMIFLGCLLTQG